MAIFDKMNSGAKNVAKKTKEMAQISKLNAMIASEQKNIEETTYEIGKQYFDKYKDRGLEELAPLCNSIIESNKKIEQYEIEIKVVKGIRFCKNCNSELLEDAVFCPKCGAKVTD